MKKKMLVQLLGHQDQEYILHFRLKKKQKFLKNILSLQPNWQGKMVVELMTKEKIFILDPFMVIILYGETTIKELCCRLLFLLIELQKYTMYLYPE